MLPRPTATCSYGIPISDTITRLTSYPNFARFSKKGGNEVRTVRVMHPEISGLDSDILTGLQGSASGISEAYTHLCRETCSFCRSFYVGILMEFPHIVGGSKYCLMQTSSTQDEVSPLLESYSLQAAFPDPFECLCTASWQYVRACTVCSVWDRTHRRGEFFVSLPAVGRLRSTVTSGRRQLVPIL